MKRQSSVLGAVALLVAVVCGTSGCGDDKGKASTLDETRSVSGLSSCVVKQLGYYYVAAVAPRTGPISFFGDETERSVAQALMDINDNGGIKGRKVGLVSCPAETAGDGSDAAVTEATIAEIGAADPVVGMIGANAAPMSAAALGGLAAAKKVYVGMPLIRDGGGWAFQTVGGPNGSALDHFALLPTRPSKVAAVTTGGIAALAAAQALDAAGFAHQEFVLPEDGSVDAAETAAAVNNAIEGLVAYAPDAVVVSGGAIENFVLFLRAAAAQSSLRGLAFFLDGSLASDAIAQQVADNAFMNGMMSFSPGNKGSVTHPFEQRHRELWNLEPIWLNYFIYDATYILGIAMALASDPDNTQQVRDAFADKTKSGAVVNAGSWADALAQVGQGEMNYEGVSGPVDFDAEGHTFASLVLDRFDGTTGKWVETGDCQHAADGSVGPCE